MSDIYLDVTNKIVSALSQGVIPWIKPWTPQVQALTVHFPSTPSLGAPTPASTFHSCGLRPACEASPRIAG